MRAMQLITETIRLVRPIGQGAMGSVWLADHLALNAQVAVKFMASTYSEDAELKVRFRKEAQAAAQIRSPHVAQVLAHGETPDGALYIVMELLEGETLQKRMKRLGPLPLAEVVEIVSHVANALGPAHRIGLVHRDIKPDNLFVIDVGGKPFIKVIDFGIAKRVQPEEARVTATGRMMGTPLYMSPEQFNSAKDVDERSDLWSLAVVAYQALTGRLPFTGEALGALSASVSAGEFPAPSSLRPGLPAEVDAWMKRALHRDILARFISARELAETLQQAVAAAGRRTTPVPSQDRDRRREAPTSGVPTPAPSRRRPLVGSPPEARPKDPPTPRPTPRPTAEEPKDTPGLEMKVSGRIIRVVRGKLERAGTEAIVNAADSPGVLVERASRFFGGPDLPEITRLHGMHPVGTAMLTTPRQAPPPVRAIIHALLPSYGARSDSESAVLLGDAHLASLRIAEEQGIRSVAFPGISTGTHGYPTFKAAPIVIDAAVQHLKAARSVELIVFVLLTEASHELFNAALTARARG